MKKDYERPKEYLASVYTNGKCTKRRVECLISFSDNPALYPKIAIILSNNSTLTKIASAFHIDIKARLYDMRGKLMSEVKTIGGYYLNPEERFYEYMRDKPTIEIGYSELIESCYLPRPPDNLTKNILEFSLVNINFSFSFGVAMHDEKGIHHELKSHFGKMSIIDGAVMSFKSAIRYSKVDDDKYRKHSEEILSIEYEADKSNPKRLKAFVSSLLPYISFLSGSNVGYNHIRQLGQQSKVLIDKYRVITISPRNSRYHLKADDTIDTIHHKQFIEEAVSTLSSGVKPDIQSIYRLNNAISVSVDLDSYVILFMSLEALIDGYVNTIRRQFTQFLVKKYPYRMNRKMSRRNYFRKKVRKESEKFANKYQFILTESNIGNSDLWPLYDSGANYLSLSRIRNKIVHQGTIRDRENLWCAFCHLEWIYLRLFLYIVGWNGPNKLTPQALSSYVPYAEWHNMLIYK